MDQIKINETLTVRASPEAVVICTADACNTNGEAFPFEVHLVLSPEDAIKFASAVLSAALNLPEQDFSEVPNA